MREVAPGERCEFRTGRIKVEFARARFSTEAELVEPEFCRPPQFRVISSKEWAPGSKQCITNGCFRA